MGTLHRFWGFFVGSPPSIVFIWHLAEGLFLWGHFQRNHNDHCENWKPVGVFPKANAAYNKVCIIDFLILIRGFLELLFQLQNHFNCKTSLETECRFWKLVKQVKSQFIDLPGMDTAYMQHNYLGKVLGQLSVCV